MNGKQIYDREALINTRGRKKEKVYVNGQPLPSVRNDISGGVISFREAKSVCKLITQVSVPDARFTFDDIIGSGTSLKNAVELAKKVASSDAIVLLQGESGTGKEMFAQAIHNASTVRDGPFVAINCGAISFDLIESELFGYEEGAFTGARKGGRIGKFELAKGGTIFLDEIGSMPLQTQSTLLRVLQEKQFMRVGGNEIIEIDCRVIVADNRDLSDEVKKGNFREDLFYRINVIPIMLPPLREWSDDDILVLVEHFLNKVCNEKLCIETKIISDDAKKAIFAYKWPGNIRELSNVIERAVYVSSGPVIKKEDLPKSLRCVYISPQEQTQIKQKDFVTLSEVEKNTIINTVNALKGNIKKSAEVLGISRNTLYRKIEVYGIYDMIQKA